MEEEKNFIKHFLRNRGLKSTTVRELVKEFINKHNLDNRNYHIVRNNIIKAIEDLSWEDEIEIIAGLGLAADDDIEFLAKVRK